jgi:hypothetical protein
MPSRPSQLLSMHCSNLGPKTVVALLGFCIRVHMDQPKHLTFQLFFSQAMASMFAYEAIPGSVPFMTLLNN